MRGSRVEKYELKSEKRAVLYSPPHILRDSSRTSQKLCRFFRMSSRSLHRVLRKSLESARSPQGVYRDYSESLQICLGLLKDLQY
jgi:hypothetical protein